MKYDPWHDSHAPKNFERTDPTGRWSPIIDQPEPEWVQWVGGAAAGVALALVLALFI